MNRKIMMSGISIVTALALLGGAAYAQFVVTASASGNTFSSGNPALELCNDNAGVPYGCGTTIANPISLANLIPGVPQTFNFWLDNTGNDDLTSLTTLFSGANGTGSAVGSGLSSNILETDLSVSISCDSTSGSATAGPAAFNVWESTINMGGTLATGAESLCAMTVTLPATNTTDANQALGFNATFGGQTVEP